MGGNRRLSLGYSWWWWRVDCMYSVDRKATPPANRHDKSTTRARARAGSPLGFSVCSRGLAYVRGVKVSAMLTNKIKIWLVRGYARVTPPPLHLLCKPDIFFLLFRLSIWLICEPLGKPAPQTKNPPLGEPTGGPFM